jgi:hypothetical protein
MLRGRSGRALDFGGYQLMKIEPLRHDEVRLTLRDGESVLRVLVAPRRGEQPAYLFAGPLALFHPKGEPIDEISKDRALRRMAQVLTHQMKVRSRRAKARGQPP